MRLRGVCGLLACLILGSLGLSAHAAPKSKSKTEAATAAAICQQAQARFDADDLAGAAKLLDRAPTQDASDRELADIANLRGAINLRRHHYDKARDAFDEAAKKDPKLWAARFNAAEVSFRRGKYDEASRQFSELEDSTRGFGKGPERRLAEYKHLLAELLAGREKPARDFVAEHRDDKTQPLEYHYLVAALERQHGHKQKAGESLAQARAKYSPQTEDIYADSFRDLGWKPAESGRLVAMVNDQGATGSTPAADPVAKAEVKTPAARKTAVSEEKAKPVSAPEAVRPAFRTGSDAPAMPSFREGEPAARDVNGQMPPMMVDARQPQTLVEDAVDTRTGTDAPTVLGKPSSSRKPRATPSPSAVPTATPAADATSGASPAPAVGPSASPAASPAASSAPGATPAPAFVQKYEAAYVKYLEKDYPAAKTLLDEADVIQPGQKSSSDLRDLIFKAYYEGSVRELSARATFPRRPGPVGQRGRREAQQPGLAEPARPRALAPARLRRMPNPPSRRRAQLDPDLLRGEVQLRRTALQLPQLHGGPDAVRGTLQPDRPRQAAGGSGDHAVQGVPDAAARRQNRRRRGSSWTTSTSPGRPPPGISARRRWISTRGNMEKAQGWIDSAGKEFKPQLVSIFKESFYRIGWMSDVNGQPSLAGRPGPVVPPEALPGASPAAAVASASASPAASPAGSPAAVLAMNAATPGATVPPGTPTPAASVAASATPVAATPTPKPAVALATATPVPKPSATLAAASVAPTPTPKPSASLAAATIAPTPIKPPASTPLPTAAPTVSLASVTPAPSLAAASATPAPTVAAASASPVPASASPSPSAVGAASAVTTETPDPTAESTPGAEASDEETPQLERLFQLLFLGLIVIFIFTDIILVLKLLARRKERESARRNAYIAAYSQEELEPEETQTPR